MEISEILIPIDSKDFEAFEQMVKKHFPIKGTMQIIETKRDFAVVHILLQTNDSINFYRLGREHAKLRINKLIEEL